MGRYGRIDIWSATIILTFIFAPLIVQHIMFEYLHDDNYIIESDFYSAQYHKDHIEITFNRDPISTLNVNVNDKIYKINESGVLKKLDYSGSTMLEPPERNVTFIYHIDECEEGFYFASTTIEIKFDFLIPTQRKITYQSEPFFVSELECSQSDMVSHTQLPGQQ